MNTDLAAQRALDRLAKAGVAALTESDNTLAAAWLFEAGVSNSGLARYFSGKRGDLASEAPAALRAIGAGQMAEIAAEANAVFGKRGPPRDRAERQRLVKALPESARAKFTELEKRYDECREDIEALLENYLAARRS